MYIIYTVREVQISIQALREEGDSGVYAFRAVGMEFLSTPSARRATWWSTQTRSTSPFLSTPSARRATRQLLGSADAISISIHALREEGDDGGRHGRPNTWTFLSTPSARRATGLASSSALGVSNFYPRPPRGGRPLLRLQKSWWIKFLSTPSARRATAKTERKHPAFVSLYTSLHKLQRDACKTNRKITPLLAQTAGIPVRSVPENHVCCRFALAGHQKISTLSWANSGCSPTCSTLVW